VAEARIQEMKRVLIIGGPGAGKSTLARRLHAVTGLPLYHLDTFFWRPGWAAPPKEEWFRQVAELAVRDEWIMDGGYSNTFPIRMPRADTIIWLDLPRRVCIPRILKRRISNFGRVRSDAAPGCPEALDLDFLKWAWTFNKVHAAKYRVALATHAPHAHVARLRSRRETEMFIHSLSR
jgi:adenylate kinase family enzyme